MRKICVISGKRGGFNALIPTMRLIEKDAKLKLQLVLTDMHLSRQFGYTIREAEKWFKVAETIPLGQKDDSPQSRTEALGEALKKMAGTFAILEPDIVLLLGDRSETVVAAFAALQLRIPIAHIQGGEISGNIDGIQRHAITKLAHLHFTETRKAAERVIMLGEEKWRVFFTGAPYVDFIKQKLYSSPDVVQQKFNLQPKEKFLLCLQHPVTTEPEKSYQQMKETIKALRAFPYRSILVYPCSDQGYQGIVSVIEQARAEKKFSIYKNIPAPDFLGLENLASALVGNSSAGIYEAPYLHLPAVNIGKRQQGRERENNVIDVPHEAAAIIKAIERIISSAQFKKQLKQLKYIYGRGDACSKIVKALKEVKLDNKLFEKKLTF